MKPPVRSVSSDPVLREQIELLVRPTRRSLVPQPSQDRLCHETGGGSGRIGKDQVTSAVQLRQFLRAASGEEGALPLLVSVNQEGGRLDALDWPHVEQLPGNLALGAAADDRLAERAGAAIGGHLRAVGLRWDLAPVCDLAAWPSASAVGTRAFASDPELVARLAAGFIRGLQRAGVAATAKHFPGLDGVPADPHLCAPVVDELAPGSLVPFQAAVDAGVACVMLGSHTVRELDTCPAVFSSHVVGLLRDRLGFDGVIVSENLSIPAVHEPVGGVAPAAVAALAAGVDVVMLDSEISRGHQPYQAVKAGVQRRDEAVQALVRAVESGVVRRGQVAESAERMRRLHQRFGLPTGAELPQWNEANALAGDVAQEIARRSMTVVRGAHLLPLKPQSVLATVRVPDPGDRRADSARHAPDLLPDLLRERHQTVHQLPPGCTTLPEQVDVVLVYGYDTRTPTGSVSLAAAEAARMAGRGAVVVQVAWGDVDDLAGSPADVLVAAFSPHHASVDAVADVLLGRLQPNGVLPVTGASW